MKCRLEPMVSRMRSRRSSGLSAALRATGSRYGRFSR